jgi:phosphoglycolate phosphatase-like HAD superfamily hydrolase
MLLIFDIDGTLIDTQKIDDDCFITAFQDEYGLELHDIDWVNFKNVTDFGLFIELYEQHFHKKPDSNTVKKFQNRFFEYLHKALLSSPDNFKAVEGASDFIRFCNEKEGIYTAFATGGWQYSAKMKLEAAQIPYADIPLNSSDDLISRIDILSQAIRLSKQHYDKPFFEKYWYFGDGVWDFKATQALQIPFIGVDIRQDNKLRQLGVEHIIRDFLDDTLIFNLL